jgi:hypothetical protein
MIRMITWCLLLGSALPSLAAEPSEFRFSKEIDRGKTREENIVAVTFDSDVYAGTRVGFPDLRIFNKEEQEVPCLVEKATETRMHTVRETCNSRVLSLQEQGNGIELIVQLEGETPSADGLVIYTPLANFERRVSVFGRTEGIGWKPLVAEGLVFDYSRYMDIGNREVRLPKNDCRQFKVVISDIADSKESPFLEMTRKYQGGSESERIEKTVLERRAFRMDRIELWHEKDEKFYEYEKKAEYPVAEFRVEENAAEKETLIYVNTRCEPLTGLTLETASRNFNRSARVQISENRGGRSTWVDIGQGGLSRVKFGSYHNETLGLSFPEQREKEYRIVIRNEDNPPLKITGVKAKGNIYRAVFLAEENETFRLGYGSDEVDPPNYDAAAVLAPLRQGRKAEEARLAKESDNAPATPEPNFKSLINNPLLLGGGVVLLVAVLGWALFRAAHRINEIPKE